MTTIPNKALAGWNFSRKAGLRRIALRQNGLGNNYEPAKHLLLGRTGRIFKTWDGRIWNRPAFWYQANTFGSVTDHVSIDENGFLSLVGSATVFDDLRIEPTTRNTGAKAPTFTNWLGGLYLYDFDDALLAAEKEIFFTVQLPHSWREGSAVEPHVHWVAKSAGTAGQVVRWGLEYTKQNIGAAFSAPSTVYATTIAGGGSIATQDSHLITDFDAIDMTGETISTVIVCRLFRNSSNAADTYTGTAGLLYIDWHYEINSMGSRQEYVK
jgi:hypothetical protein